jgi:hypothetical protein
MPGPVWHVSVASQGIPYGRTALEAQAERELEQVGDAGRGEWREWSGRAFHLRRRLSESEEAMVGPVMDIRGTDEARRRAKRLGRLLAYVPDEVVGEELGRRA